MLLESLKSWIEGLFKPTITVSSAPGVSYINRTPTVWDLTGQHTYAQDSITVGAAAGWYYSGYITAVGEAVVIDGISISGTLTSIWLSYDITDGSRSIRSYPVAAIAGVTTLSPNLPYPQYLYPGERMRIALYYAGGAGTTVTSTIRYKEVRI